MIPTTSLIGIKPKQLIGPKYQDYPEYDHYREQMIHKHAIYPKQNDLIETQIRVYALLLKQLKEEKRDQPFKQNTQVEYNVPSCII